MKRIFPLIAFLITLSLLGLIFFQFLWLKSAREAKEQQIHQSVQNAVGSVGLRLIEEKSPLILMPKKSNMLLPNEKKQIDLYNSSVSGRYTLEEIHSYLRAAFDQDKLLRGVPFEFALVTSSLVGETMQSPNFYKFYEDTANNIQYVTLLNARPGSDAEGIGLEESLNVIVPHQQTFIMRGLTEFIIGAVLFTLIIATAFFITIRTLLRQKKLSEIKNDFINNMTHEFKTPLATISLAVDALKNDKVVADKEKTQYFTNIIKEENRRMNKQVETILQAALLDRNEVRLNLKIASAHHFIEIATNNITLPIEEKGGKLIVSLNASKDTILADEVHFTNFINSLLDNAVKYSKEAPVVKLTTSNTNHSLKIQIEDEGIGMNKETLSKIFEKFFRAHTGNVHNVKGFGLGLTYVKTMVEAHHGQIKAESTPGKGSSFVVTIPLAE